MADMPWMDGEQEGGEGGPCGVQVAAGYEVEDGDGCHTRDEGQESCCERGGREEGSCAHEQPEEWGVESEVQVHHLPESERLEVHRFIRRERLKRDRNDPETKG